MKFQTIKMWVKSFPRIVIFVGRSENKYLVHCSFPEYVDRFCFLANVEQNFSWLMLSKKLDSLEDRKTIFSLDLHAIAIATVHILIEKHEIFPFKQNIYIQIDLFSYLRIDLTVVLKDYSLSNHTRKTHNLHEVDHLFIST